MEINVHGKHSHVPKSLQEFAEEKMQHLGKYLSTIRSIDVEIYKEGARTETHVAHVTVSTSGPVFRSKVSSQDPRASIDIAADRLERRLKEFKRRRSGKPLHSRNTLKAADKANETKEE